MSFWRWCSVALLLVIAASGCRHEPNVSIADGAADGARDSGAEASPSDGAADGLDDLAGDSVAGDSRFDLPLPDTLSIAPKLGLRYADKPVVSTSGSLTVDCAVASETVIGGGGVGATMSRSWRSDEDSWQIRGLNGSSAYALCVDTAVGPWFRVQPENGDKAACNANEWLVGGGFDCGPSGYATTAYPLPGLQVFQASCTQGTTMTWAVCTSRPALISALVRVTPAIGDAKCPAGTKVIGGGCKAGSSVAITRSQPYEDLTSGKTGWRCDAAGTATAESYAICVRQP
ncbi:MAG: hypothetical protein KC503_26155 [Myxococcales bacterium]|nr:hypothetical protein [Myxococcales bacterium]